MTEIYMADIRELYGRDGEALPLLTADRRSRAERIMRPEGRLQRIAAGLLMRRIFGSAAPVLAEHGKPFFPEGPCFNISHGGAYAVLAVSVSDIGADIERIRAFDSRVAKRLFTDEEQQWAGDSPERFFTVWTMKESCMKATGTGFAVSPASFSVYPCSSGLLSVQGRQWFFDVREADGHILSVCAKGPVDRVTLLSCEQLLS